MSARDDSIYVDGREAERAAVVAYIRKTASLSRDSDAVLAYLYAADAIEAGEHLKERR